MGQERWLFLAWIMPAALVVVAAAVLSRHKSPELKYPVALTSAKLTQDFEAAREHGIGDRIAFWSESLLQNPELLAPLGPGPEVNDSAPLFPHGFDCTTYVETVGALSRSQSAQELADRLIQIRYRRSEVAYENRNHFPEADWIPNNEEAGVLKDITVETSRKAGFMASFVNKDIDKVAWFKSQSNEAARRMIARIPTSDSISTVRLAYIPLEKMMDAIQHVPQGAVLNVVRENRERQPVLITHQGFLIWKNGVAYFRHASRNKEIKEVPFAKYVRENRHMPWRVLGFNVNAFQG